MICFLSIDIHMTLQRYKSKTVRKEYSANGSFCSANRLFFPFFFDNNAYFVPPPRATYREMRAWAPLYMFDASLSCALSSDS